MLSEPFIPDAAASMLAGMQTEDRSWPGDVAAALAVLEAGHAFTVPEVLFRKVTDEEREEWAVRFGGVRA